MWKLGDQRWKIVPNHTYHGSNVGLRYGEVPFPIWIELVKIRNRFVTAIAESLEQWDVVSERLFDEILVISTHRDDKIILLQQLAGEAALNVPGDVNAFLTKTARDPLVHLLWFGFNSRRANAIGRCLSEQGLQPVLGGDASKHVAGTDEEDRLHPCAWFFHAPPLVGF